MSDDLLAHLEALEVQARRLAAAQQDAVARLVDSDIPGRFGVTAAQLLRSLLRLSAREAKDRVERAADLAPRRGLFGAVLPARLPATAAAQAELWAGHARTELEWAKSLSKRLSEGAYTMADDPGSWRTVHDHLKMHS